MIYETDDQLNQACAEWQKVLGVQDWDVKCCIKRSRDMNMQEAQAECQWTIQNKQATINICDPVDYPPHEWEQDMEDSLVHELMHLHCAPFDDFERFSAEDTALEQMIVKTSGALIRLKRDKQGNRQLGHQANE